MFGVTGGKKSTVAERLKIKEELKRQEKTLRKAAGRSTSVTVYKPGEGSSTFIASQKVAKAHGIEIPNSSLLRQQSEGSVRKHRENLGPLASQLNRASIPSQGSHEGSDGSHKDVIKVEEGKGEGGNISPVASIQDARLAIDDSECLEVLNRMERFIMEIRSYIKQLAEFTQNKEKRIDYKDEKAQEWHAVAVALDRTFFFLYLAMLFVVAIVSSAILFPRTF